MTSFEVNGPHFNAFLSIMRVRMSQFEMIAYATFSEFSLLQYAQRIKGMTLMHMYALKYKGHITYM